MPESTPILCPQCHRTITMTVQGALQARDLGVAVECVACHAVWLYRSHPTPVFGPLASPKRRRGRIAPLASESTDDHPDDPEKPRASLNESDDRCQGI